MTFASPGRAFNRRAALLAGAAAAIVSTAAQIVLWIAFTNDFPSILLRDARLAAAILLGPGALAEGARAPATIVFVATLVHFALSLGYGALLGAVMRRRSLGVSLAAGALFGVVLYAVNMHGFTTVFPWFSAARDPITFAAHVVFGMTAAFVYRRVDAQANGR